MANPAIRTALKRYGKLEKQGGFQYSPPKREEWNAPHLERSTAVTTLETVINRTSITLGLLILTAIITYASISSYEISSTFATALFVVSLTSLGLSFWISFSKTTRAWSILLFSALEGIVIGAFSKAIAIQMEGSGAIWGAIGGTFITFMVTLGVYKYLDLKPSVKFNKWLAIAMFSFIGVSLLDLVLGFFGAALGFNGFGTLGLIFSLVGVGLAILMLISDFGAVESAISMRLPEVESWRLAYSLTVTLVWVYVNLLKIIASLNRR